MTEAIVAPAYKRLPLNANGELLKNGFMIKSPRNMVIVKYPKSGSTLSLVDVPKILIADSEGGTEDFNATNSTNLLDSTVIDEFKETNNFGWLPQTIFDLVDELKKANRMKEYWVLYNTLKNERDLVQKERHYNALIEFINKLPFPIVAVDTITSIQGLSNAAALFEYNKSVSKPKTDITRVDEYSGVVYVRRKFNEIKRFIEMNAAPFIQYHGHVAPRKKILKKAEADISSVDIALSGIQSITFTSQAQAVCTFYREKTGCYLDFTKADESDMGSRSLHLSNKKIKIAEITKDEDLEKGIRPITHWGEIYPELHGL